MIKKILTVQLATFCIYILLYLIKTFVIWKITNPFLWIINLPDYDSNTRGLILTGFVCYYFCWVPYLFPIKTK